MLTELQVKKLTRYFQVYDIDDDGRIERSDFERIVENVTLLHGDGPEASGLRAAYMARWDQLRASADMDGDRGIDLDEWLAYWQIALEEEGRGIAEAEAITDRLFSVFDLDEDDRIGPGEFADFYGIFGLSVELSRDVFDALDTDGDGVLTRDELTSRSRDFYLGDDVEAPGNLLFGPYGA